MAFIDFKSIWRTWEVPSAVKEERVHEFRENHFFSTDGFSPLTNSVSACSATTATTKSKASPAGTSFCAWPLPNSLSEWWWRHELDSIFFENHCEDGLAYTKLKQISWKVKPCNDPKTHKRAGDYCMVTEQPVSDEDSKSGISWFPSGADLAHIRLD